ncbi:MAG: type I-E CRISPR-associated protein Cas7/Cse4/CasC [Chitinispirillaceae bacterium]|nr:type I-E CRISPR-associated protein Cas7/Cse4/CasC [Chitinispirillaceae bacterium]
MSEQKNFINFHVLISHSPSCLNRDDQNMQKRAVFGGVERIRISSQSLKRAMRRPPESWFNYWKDGAKFGTPSTRTRSVEGITKYMLKELSDEFKNDDAIQKTIMMFVKTQKAKTDEEIEDDDDDQTENNDSKKIAVAPWVVGEIKELCRIIKNCRESGLSEEDKAHALKKVGKEVGKKGNKRKLTEEDCIEEAILKKITTEIEKKKEVISAAAGTAVDLALWGRMATSGLMTNVDGSLSVAHAITTHSAQAETDWFTAVDDLVKTGTGHLDTQEFSSGVFYRYASLNVAQLQKNLGGATRERALEIAKHVFHMLCTVVPSAKQLPFAAYNTADFAIVSFSDMPISMANAFEKPIPKEKEGGFYRPSVRSLFQFWNETHRFIGLDEKTAFCLNSAVGQLMEIIGIDDEKIFNQTGISPKASLVEIEKWIEKDGAKEENKE